MSAPVGHIVCALALMANSATKVDDKQAFLVGTVFPDIRYISDVQRSTTHNSSKADIANVLAAPSSFEAGRRFHIYIDRERERFMRKRRAYRFISNSYFKAQILKIVEDHILFERLLGKFDSQVVFSQTYPEQLDFGVKPSEIDVWHRLMTNYLDQSQAFSMLRYYRSLNIFQSTQKMPSSFFNRLWHNIKITGFFIYAYFQIEKLSRNKELRKIILEFYDEELNRLISPAKLEKKGHGISHSHITACNKEIFWPKVLALLRL